MFLNGQCMTGDSSVLESPFEMHKVVGSNPVYVRKSRVQPRVDYSHKIAMFLQRDICLTTSSSQSEKIYAQGQTQYVTNVSP